MLMIVDDPDVLLRVIGIDLDPVREAPVLLASTAYANGAVPVPGLPEVTCIHESMVLAFHPQLEGAVTFTLPVTVVWGSEAALGARVYEQTSPDWVMVNGNPATVIVPTR